MKASDWISVKDRLPEVDVKVLVCTKKGMFSICSTYIPKDIYGKVLGDKQWRCSSIMGASITHWQPIVLPKKENL